MTLVIVFALACAGRASAQTQTITVINHAGISPAVLARVERAVQRQANRQLRLWWHTPKIVFGVGGWPFLLKYSNAGDWGDHGTVDWTATGEPTAEIGIDPTVAPLAEHRRDWTLTFSHELLEMLLNPSGMAKLRGLYREACDAVQANWYSIDGVAVSDFVAPHWFVKHSHGPWDWRRKLHKAREIAYGGDTPSGQTSS